jgi:hypothetical protein
LNWCAREETREEFAQRGAESENCTEIAQVKKSGNRPGQNKTLQLVELQG